MIDFFYFFFQRGNVFFRHIFNHHERKRTFAEIIHQRILANNRIHLLREIIQHIVIDSGINHAENRGNQ